MFIRIKKISKQNYAYLVENTWKKRRRNKVKQKTLKYLGRVYKIEKTQNKSLEEFLNTNLENYLKKSTYKKIILDLIKLELINHNFTQKNNIFKKNDFYINLTKKEVLNNQTNKQICLEVNNNFLCSYTLRKLLNFTPKHNLTKLQIGKQLANTLESTGIIAPKTIFIEIAQKVLKEVEIN